MVAVPNPVGGHFAHYNLCFAGPNRHNNLCVEKSHTIFGTVMVMFASARIYFLQFILGRYATRYLSGGLKNVYGK